MRVGCVLLAAGRSTRMGGGDKLLARLGDRPVLAHSLGACEAAAVVTEVAVVTSPENRAEVAAVVRAYSTGKVRALVPGGAERQDSVAAGLAALPRADVVAVHDGARPLAGSAAFEEGAALARECGAAIAGRAIADTVKVVDEAAGEAVIETLERGRLRAAETPQVFRRELLARAHERARADGFAGTDDASLVERLGERVAVFGTAGPNPKITRREDLAIAEALLSREGASLRTGIGIDSHRFADASEGRALILGGVAVAHERGLAGHSDADVLTHAVMDALLGAAGMGDLGAHFGTADPRWAGADSVEMLGVAVRMLAEAGMRPSSVDATVIAEAPRLGGHAGAMRERLGAALGLDASRVNVKATTAEGMGALGRGEGIAAHAVATVSDG